MQFLTDFVTEAVFNWFPDWRGVNLISWLRQCLTDFLTDLLADRLFSLADTLSVPCRTWPSALHPPRSHCADLHIPSRLCRYHYRLGQHVAVTIWCHLLVSTGHLLASFVSFFIGGQGMWVCVCVCVCVYVCVHLCVYMSVCVCVCVFVLTCIHVGESVYKYMLVKWPCMYIC